MHSLDMLISYLLELTLLSLKTFHISIFFNMPPTHIPSEKEQPFEKEKLFQASKFKRKHFRVPSILVPKIIPSHKQKLHFYCN